MSDNYTNLARQAIIKYSQTNTTADINITDILPNSLYKKAGVYITLFKPNGEIRATMGNARPTKPNLAEEIIFTAITAAFFDKQFKPLRKNEIAELKIRIDIVTDSFPCSELQHCSFSKKYGILIESIDGKTAVLLPQMHSGNLQQALSIVARKARINTKLDKYKIIIFKTEIHQE